MCYLKPIYRRFKKKKKKSSIYRWNIITFTYAQNVIKQSTKYIWEDLFLFAFKIKEKMGYI